MKHFISALNIALAIFYVGCASAPPPTSASWELTLPMVSKTQSQPPSGKAKSLGNVSEKMCLTDGKLTKRIGMVDTLVASAQAKKKADYIYNAKFSRIDDFCIKMTGTAASVNHSTETPAESAESEQ